MKCKRHPKYKGIRKPTCVPTCGMCWKIYYDNHPDTMIRNPITGQENFMTIGEWQERARQSAQELMASLKKMNKAIKDFEAKQRKAPRTEIRRVA